MAISALATSIRLQELLTCVLGRDTSSDLTDRNDFPQ